MSCMVGVCLPIQCPPIHLRIDLEGRLEADLLSGTAMSRHPKGTMIIASWVCWNLEIVLSAAHLPQKSQLFVLAPAKDITPPPRYSVLWTSRGADLVDFMLRHAFSSLTGLCVDLGGWCSVFPTTARGDLVTSYFTDLKTQRRRLGSTSRAGNRGVAEVTRAVVQLGRTLMSFAQTSETIIGLLLRRVVHSWRAPATANNQWANVMRWELRTCLFPKVTAEFSFLARGPHHHATS